MDKRTKGAWLIHHAKKIQTTTNQDFDQIAFAGKSGILLSAISSSNQESLELSKIRALAKANNISPKSELPIILEELKRQRLIDTTDTHVEILGLSSYSILEHTGRIFHEGEPEPSEEAVLEISEKVSELPLKESLVAEYLSDNYQLASTNIKDLIHTSREIGFFDSEAAIGNENILFNGNLFRSNEVVKVNSLLNSLNDAESNVVRELNETLQNQGCISLAKAQSITGPTLFKRLHSVGLFDISSVGNDRGQHHFVTRPAAFSKFSDSIADDAFDLAKAFVTSLTYGMTMSSYQRGKITAISLLLQKLINGRWVGPATAIGKDYQILELKRVIEVKPAGNSMFNMRLLKPEVGRLALAVIQEGDVASETLVQLPGANVTRYTSPESNREVMRKNVSEPLKATIANLLNDIRTGGLS